MTNPRLARSAILVLTLGCDSQSSYQYCRGPSVNTSRGTAAELTWGEHLATYLCNEGAPAYWRTPFQSLPSNTLVELRIDYEYSYVYDANELTFVLELRTKDGEGAAVTATCLTLEETQRCIARATRAFDVAWVAIEAPPDFHYAPFTLTMRRLDPP